MTGKSSKQVDLTIIQSLTSAIPLGEYRVYTAARQLPPRVPWAGSTCHAVVIAASAFNGEDTPGAFSGMTPSGNVYLWRAFRADPGSPAHWNVDDALYFTNNQGRPRQIHSKSAPDHFQLIVSGSGLNDLIRDHSLPSASAGPIDAYRQAGARLDFEGPFSS